MNHKLYKIKTKIQQKIPLCSGNKSKVSTARQTVTPNKDVVGEKGEVQKQKRGGWGSNVIHSGGVVTCG